MSLCWRTGRIICSFWFKIKNIFFFTITVKTVQFSPLLHLLLKIPLICLKCSLFPPGRGCSFWINGLMYVIINEQSALSKTSTFSSTTHFDLLVFAVFMFLTLHYFQAKRILILCQPIGSFGSKMPLRSFISHRPIGSLDLYEQIRSFVLREPIGSLVPATRKPSTLDSTLPEEKLLLAKRSCLRRPRRHAVWLKHTGPPLIRFFQGDVFPRVGAIFGLAALPVHSRWHRADMYLNHPPWPLPRAPTASFHSAPAELLWQSAKNDAQWNVAVFQNPSQKIILH